MIELPRTQEELTLWALEYGQVGDFCKLYYEHEHEKSVNGHYAEWTRYVQEHFRDHVRVKPYFNSYRSGLYLCNVFIELV